MSLSARFATSGRQAVLFDDRHVGPDENPAVEACNGRPQGERLDQHRHAARRPAAGDGKGNPNRIQRLHRRLRALRQHLVFGDERAIYIGNEERHLRWLFVLARHVVSPVDRAGE
jgi:hypothetical protein